MHFLYGPKPKRSIGLGYRHRGLICLIIRYVSFQTLIELFTNSLDGEEKMNLLMPKELTSRTLARRVAQLRIVYKIKDTFKIKLRRRKI
jgi:hypothetical protein